MPSRIKQTSFVTTPFTHNGFVAEYTTSAPGSLAGVFETLEGGRMFDALEELEAQLATQLEEAVKAGNGSFGSIVSLSYPAHPTYYAQAPQGLMTVVGCTRRDARFPSLTSMGTFAKT